MLSFEEQKIDELEERVRILEAEKARAWNLYEHLVTTPGAEQNRLRSALSVLIRVMADSLPCSFLEGPDVAAALLDAGLLEEARTEDGRAGWRLNPFAQKILKHENPQKGEDNADEPDNL